MDNFLRLRARELAAKGKLLITLVTSDDDMQVDSDLHEHATDSLLALVNAGRVTSEEARKVMVSVHYRSPSEVRASLESCADIFAVDELKFDRIAHPLHKKCLAGELGKAEYAEISTNFFKAIFEPSVIVSLNSSRSGLASFPLAQCWGATNPCSPSSLLFLDAEKQAIANEIFTHIKEKVTEKPSPCHFYMGYVLLSKK